MGTKEAEQIVLDVTTKVYRRQLFDAVKSGALDGAASPASVLQSICEKLQLAPEAGAYTRSLLSSTLAMSDTQNTLHTIKTPSHPLYMGYTIPKRTPYPIKSAQVELRSERV